MSRPISIVEAVRLDTERKLADDFAAIIHGRHMRFRVAETLEDCLDYDDHYGLAWAMVRHLFGPELDAEELNPMAPWNKDGQ